jgi:hypothetical protein
MTHSWKSEDVLCLIAKSRRETSLSTRAWLVSREEERFLVEVPCRECSNCHLASFVCI